MRNGDYGSALSSKLRDIFSEIIKLANDHADFTLQEYLKNNPPHDTDLEGKLSECKEQLLSLESRVAVLTSRNLSLTELNAELTDRLSALESEKSNLYKRALASDKALASYSAAVTVAQKNNENLSLQILELEDFIVKNGLTVPSLEVAQPSQEMPALSDLPHIPQPISQSSQVIVSQPTHAEPMFDSLKDFSKLTSFDSSEDESPVDLEYKPYTDTGKDSKEEAKPEDKEANTGEKPSTDSETSEDSSDFIDSYLEWKQKGTSSVGTESFQSSREDYSPVSYQAATATSQATPSSLSYLDEGEDDFSGLEWKPQSVAKEPANSSEVLSSSVLSQLDDFDDSDLEWKPTPVSNKAVSPSTKKAKEYAAPDFTQDEGTDFSDLEWKPQAVDQDNPDTIITFDEKPSGKVGKADKAGKSGKANAVKASQSAAKNNEKIIKKLEAIDPKFAKHMAEQARLEELHAPIRGIAESAEEIERKRKAELYNDFTGIPGCKVLPPLETAPSFSTSDDPELLQLVRDGYDILYQGDYDGAWAFFRKLEAKYPNNLEIQKGIFDSYAGSEGWSEACKVGMPLIYDMAQTKYWSQFSESLDRVLKECLVFRHTLNDRKELFLGLAELHLDKPAIAIPYLRQAISIPCPIAGESHIHYYLVRFARDLSRYKFDDVIEAMKGVDTRTELFDDLISITNDDRYRGHLPLVKLIDALFRKDRQTAATVEKACNSLVEVGPVDLSPASVEEIHDDNADKIVEFILNQLIEKAGLPPVPPVDQKLVALRDDSGAIPFGYTPASTFEKLNRKMFNFRDYDIAVYNGSQDIWIEALSEPRTTFILGRKLAELPPATLQFILLSKMFQVHHRHNIIWRWHDCLTNEMRCKLLRVATDIVKETGTEISRALDLDVNSIKPDMHELMHNLDDCIDRLYLHSISEEFMMLKDFIFSKRPFAPTLNSATDRFSAKFVGMTEASYALARLLIEDDELYKEVEKVGFTAIYKPNFDRCRILRLRLQRLWIAPFNDELW